MHTPATNSSGSHTGLESTGVAWIDCQSGCIFEALVQSLAEHLENRKKAE